MARGIGARSARQVITVAYDLSEFQHTVRSLAWLQLGIGVAVLLVLGLASYAVVSQSLRPLTEVEHTAAAIAAVSWIAVCPNVMHEPKWAGCRWR